MSRNSFNTPLARAKRHLTQWMLSVILSQTRDKSDLELCNLLSRSTYPMSKLQFVRLCRSPIHASVTELSMVLAILDPVAMRVPPSLQLVPATGTCVPEQLDFGFAQSTVDTATYENDDYKTLSRKAG